MALNLLPQPRNVNEAGGVFALPATGEIMIRGPLEANAALYHAAKRLQASIQAAQVGNYTIAAGAFPATITLELAGNVGHAQGYVLTVGAQGICITGHDAAGVFYGVCTLIQLIQVHGNALPTLEIEDWPDFPARGVMLDVSRDKVPTLDTLYQIIDKLSGLKINQFQLYMEHTFAYREHAIVWGEASPLTAEDILALDVYCRERHIDLVPNQNSFGHMHRWFEHKEYLHLAETEGGVVTPWGEQTKEPFSLSPAVPETVPFIDSLFAELLPNFTSRLFNVGADETFDLGMGRSKTMVETQGKGRVYLDFLLKIYELTKKYGRTMQFWGDIIGHYPELVPSVPRDVIALEWGYEASHDYAQYTKMFAEAGVPFYVCPGTSTWTTITGRTDNMRQNIRNAAENGLKNGAIGLLNTDWGDWGHWQPLPASYAGYAYGAAMAWCVEANAEIDLAAALSAFVFRDKTNTIGKAVLALGNAHQEAGVQVVNGSLLFWLYHFPLEHLRARFRHLSAGQDILHDDEKLRAGLLKTLERVEAEVSALEHAALDTPDAELVKREYVNAGRMLRHGARRGLWALGGDVTAAELGVELDTIMPEYRALWLARNRPGGLRESLARLEAARAALV